MIIDAYRRDYPRATPLACMPLLQRLVCAVPRIRAGHQEGGFACSAGVLLWTAYDLDQSLSLGNIRQDLDSPFPRRQLFDTGLTNLYAPCLPHRIKSYMHSGV